MTLILNLIDSKMKIVGAMHILYVYIAHMSRMNPKLNKRIYSLGFLPLVAALFFLFFKPANAQNVHALKVLTYNAALVCVGPGCIFADSPEPLKRAKQIGEWIRALDADVVFLQEIWQPDQFEILQKASGFPHAFFPGKPSESAILSRFQLRNAEFVPLVWHGVHHYHLKIVLAGYRAGLVLAEIEHSNGQRIGLANIHAIPRDQTIPGFHEPRDAATLGRQLGLIHALDILQNKFGNAPVIFGGDFNMNQFSEEYQFFMKSQGWIDSFRQSFPAEQWIKQCTFCDENEFLKSNGGTAEGILDYIFTTRSNTAVLSSEVISPRPALSDHYGIFSQIQIKQPGEMNTQGQSSYSFDHAALPQIHSYVEGVQPDYLCWILPSCWSVKSNALNYLKRVKSLY